MHSIQLEYIIFITNQITNKPKNSCFFPKFTCQEDFIVADLPHYTVKTSEYHKSACSIDALELFPDKESG